MIKILHVIPSLRKGGAERLAIDICNGLNRRNDAQAMLMVLREENGYPELIRDIPLKVCDSMVQLSVLGQPRIDLRDFEHVVNGFKPDIIHSHLFEAEILSREKIFPAVRYFTHCHDNMPQLDNFSISTLFDKKRFTNFYEKKHLVERYSKCNNNFIAISEDTKTYFNKVLPRGLKKNVSLLHNAIDFKLFNSVNTKRDLNKIRIINVGSFVGKKNQRFLVDIGEQLKNMGIGVEIKMLGEGNLRNEVVAYIKRRGLEEMFSLPGNVNRVEDFYAEANIYVHTATYEPFGLVLLEAMASGLPVVSLDGKGNRGLVKDGANGFFINKQNSSAFAGAIMKVTADEKRYEELSQNAVDFARGFDITLYIDKLMERYKSA